MGAKNKKTNKAVTKAGGQLKVEADECVALGAENQ
jgi:hypothetical protein